METVIGFTAIAVALLIGLGALGVGIGMGLLLLRGRLFEVKAVDEARPALQVEAHTEGLLRHQEAGDRGEQEDDDPEDLPADVFDHGERPVARRGSAVVRREGRRHEAAHLFRE